MDASQRRARLRRIFAGQSCVMASSVFDPVSARIGDELGFEVGLMGGSVASFSVLGAPDIILLTLTELADQVRRVCRAGALSVVVDGDHGYGNALNVMRSVEELENAGAAAMMVEDSLLPRPFGPSSAPVLIPLDEAVGKMKAAVEARRESGMVILGRTNALAATGIDDAIARLQAFEAVGVDALFLPGVRDRAQLDPIAKAVKLPLMLGGGHERLADYDYLAAAGVRVWSPGHHPFAAAVEAMYRTLKAMRAGVPPSKLENIASSELMDRVLRAADHERCTERFLGG